MHGENIRTLPFVGKKVRKHKVIVVTIMMYLKDTNIRVSLNLYLKYVISIENNFM